MLEEECKVLRKGHTDVSIVEGENVRLHAIVKDFTRRGGFLQSGTKSKMSSSSSTLAMVPVEGGARTVDQLVETVNGVLATDACVLGADAYESIAILDDELSILRSCLVGLGERSRTSRYSQYLMDDNLTPLCVGNRVRDTKEDMHSRVEGLEEQLALVDERIVSAATHLGAASSGSVSIEDELAMKEALENQLEVARASLKSSSSHELERKSLCTSILSQVDYLEASKRRVRRSGDGGMRSRLQSLLRKFGRNDVDSSQPGTVSSTPTASTCYSAEDVVVPAADDLKIPISSKESVKLSWQIKVKSPGDVGFAVMRQRENSSLEFMNEYSRVMNSVGELWLPNQTGSTVTWLILLDNSFSWMRQKNLSYKVVVETFSSSGDDEDGDSVGEQASAITPKASSTMDIYRKTTAFLAKMVLDV